MTFLLVFILSTSLIIIWLRWRKAARADYIRSYALPPGLYAKLQAKRPELTLKDCQLTAHALRRTARQHTKRQHALLRQRLLRPEF